MKKNFFSEALLFFIGFFIISSCKKDSSNTSTGTASSFTISSAGDPSGTYSGIFTEADHGGVEDVSFYITPVALHYSTSARPTATGTVPALYLNNVKLKQEPVYLSYSDTTFAAAQTSNVWMLNGNSIFPSFTYTYATPWPTYNNGANLPAVINRAQNLTIPTSGASGYDQILINIADSIEYTTSYQCVSASATSVIFVKDTLAKLTPTHEGSMNVYLIKYHPQTLAGKNYLFTATVNCYKSNIVIQ
jgi:hypothetical protein